jgi:hypothetical protein
LQSVNETIIMSIMSYPIRVRFAKFIAQLVAGKANMPQFLASIKVRVNDADVGWQAETIGSFHDKTAEEIQKAYGNALTAWRKNPMAWRIVNTVSNFVLGDGITVTAKNKTIKRFVESFWSDELNQITNKLQEWSDELSRAGTLIILLFRDPVTGSSWVRELPVDRVKKLETRTNDYQTITAVVEKPRRVGEEEKVWPTMFHTNANESDAVALVFTVNKPVGALLGEGDLTSILPWLQRYSRMLEDRVRLHWALRMFYWFVTVPEDKVEETRKRYSKPPRDGTIIVKSKGEEWDVKAPAVRGQDAGHDMHSVRRMIYAGSNLPSHWFAEQDASNLATARATQSPTERFLRRRQLYFIHILLTVIHTAYTRAYQVGKVSKKPPQKPLDEIYIVNVADISRDDNMQLAQAGRDMARAFRLTAENLPGKSRSLSTKFLNIILKAMGEKVDDDEIAQIINEAFSQQEIEDDDESSPNSPNQGQGQQKQESKADPAYVNGSPERVNGHYQANSVR